MLCFCFLTSARAEEAKPSTSVDSKEPASAMSTPIEYYIERLYLNIYDAAQIDLSACKEDKYCLRDAKRVKFWNCVSGVCDGSDKKMLNPGQCFGGVPEGTSKEEWDKLSAKLCEFVGATDDKEARQALINLNPEKDETFLVVSKAHLKAIKDSAKACEDYIKEYLGPLSDRWTMSWYSALAGCRILSQERSREQEEQDFYTWLGAHRKFNCYAFNNIELGNACLNILAAPPIPYVTNPDQKEPVYIQTIVDHIGLKMYEAAKEDLSTCQDDEGCLQGAKEVKAAFCVAQTCPGKASDKKPAKCFDNSFGEFSDGMKDEINKSFCPAIETMDDKSLKLLRRYFPQKSERHLAEFQAYVLAVTESSESCQNYIKHFVGPFGSQWDYEWYRALSGCRILSGESSREKEENDFYRWIGTRRAYKCDDIVDVDAKQGCQKRDITKDFFTK